MKARRKGFQDEGAARVIREEIEKFMKERSEGGIEVVEKDSETSSSSGGCVGM